MTLRTLTYRLIGVAATVATLLMPGTMHGTELLDTSTPKQFLEMSVHAGVGTSTIINNYSKVVSELTSSKQSAGTRMVAGVGVEIPMRDFLAIGTGLDIAINNYSQSMILLDDKTNMLGSLLTHNHYYTLEVPAVMSVRLNLGSRVRWVSEAGLYFAYGLGGTSKTKSLVSSINSLGQAQVSTAEYNRRYYESKDPVFCTMRHGDLGVHLGTGILLNRRFGIKAVLRIGIRDLAKNFGVYNAHARTLTPTVLLSYNLK